MKKLKQIKLDSDIPELNLKKGDSLFKKIDIISYVDLPTKIRDDLTAINIFIENSIEVDDTYYYIPITNKELDGDTLILLGDIKDFNTLQVTDCKIVLVFSL